MPNLEKQVGLPLPASIHGESPTGLDLLLVHGAGLGAGIGLFAYAQANDVGLTALQSVVLVLLAWDIVGGVPALATESTSSWYAGRSRRFRVVVYALHVAQPLVATVVFDAGAAYFLAVWAPAVGVATFVTFLDESRRRPVALALVTVALVAQVTVLSPPAALVWFGPVFLLKMGFSFPVDHTWIPGPSRERRRPGDPTPAASDG